MASTASGNAASRPEEQAANWLAKNGAKLLRGDSIGVAQINLVVLPAAYGCTASNYWRVKGVTPSHYLKQITRKMKRANYV